MLPELIFYFWPYASFENPKNTVVGSKQRHLPTSEKIFHRTPGVKVSIGKSNKATKQQLTLTGDIKALVLDAFPSGSCK